MDWESVKQDVRSRYSDVNHVSADELAAWLEREGAPSPVLLDTRDRSEYDVSHLRDARVWEPGTDPSDLVESLAPSTPIVTYCSVGYRSSTAARHLQGMGFTHVVQLEGGIFGWANEGRPVYRGTVKVKKVHPFDARWGRYLKSELHATDGGGDP